jgi:mevalonate kinase
MIDRDRSFNSKVLLFGEYSVIRHSMALAIPYPLFEGRLKFNPNRSSAIDNELKAFALFCKKAVDEGQLSDFDDSSFLFDVSQGLSFESTIPQGFGVGSSGALVAAIAHRYSKKNLDSFDVPRLKELFAVLEAHFHGSSSGFDPLISYLNCPILVDENKSLERVSIPNYSEGGSCLFLLNTGRARRTEPLVNLFLEKCKSQDFDELCQNVLTQWTNQCIHSFLGGDVAELYKAFERLSTFQFEHMRPMIPKLYQDLWLKGLESQSYLLKLCGAGGGGFLLGMTHDFEIAKTHLQGHELRPLFYFNIHS